MEFNLKKLRQLAGLTQQEVGDSLSPSVSRFTVTRWENGEHSPDPVHWKKLARLYNVPVNYFYEFAEAVKEERERRKRGETKVNAGTSIIQNAERDAIAAGRDLFKSEGDIDKIITGEELRLTSLETEYILLNRSVGNDSMLLKDVELRRKIKALTDSHGG